MDSTLEKRNYSIAMKTFVWLFTLLAWVVLVATFPFSLLFCVKVAQQGEKAHITRLGKYSRTKGPGMFLVLPFVEEFRLIDMRSKILDVPKQEVITKDSVSLCVDAVIFYHISDPHASINNVEDPEKATGRLVQTTLTKLFGSQDLQDAISDKDTLMLEIQKAMDIGTRRWGIKVERVQIEEITIPENLKRAMAAEAEASREAKAKLIKAEGEIKNAWHLQKASQTLSESPHAMQLRYLQSLNTLANVNESTIVFPMPIDIELPYKNLKKSFMLDM